MPSNPILVLNSGSSSIKFSIWETANDDRRKLFEGEIEGIGAAKSSGATLWIKSWLDGADGSKIVDEKPDVEHLSAAFELVAKAITMPSFPRPIAIGHRMVCGGPTVTENQRITPALIDEMERYTAFAPLHTPAAIYIMRKVLDQFPEVPNFVCLDSWFHRDLPPQTRSLPIPEEYSVIGVRRYGAHGLSYESIVANLQPRVPLRLIVAHLGNGSSICAIRDGRSVDTSMGLTPTGGLISATRTGDIDPGVVIFILRELVKNETAAEAAANELEKVFNRNSGLLGASQLTGDMRALRKAIAEGNASARLAVDEFVYVLRKFIGAYIAVLGGLDMLVFTGGIGEHDADTRAELCAGILHLGVTLDEDRNRAAKGDATISAENSPVVIRVIPAAEDLSIVRHVCRLLKTSDS